MCWTSSQKLPANAAPLFTAAHTVKNAHMNLIVFDIKPLKRFHINMAILSGVFLLSAIILVGLDVVPVKVLADYRKTGQLLNIICIAIIFLWQAATAKKLKAIKLMENKEDKCRAYESFAKNRLLISAIFYSLFAVHWVFTQGNFVFYFLLIMFMLNLFTFPRKKFIETELGEAEIIIS